MNSPENRPERPAVFSAVTDSQIEKGNLRRMMAISIGVLFFEAINLFNPNFWSTPILWGGAVYLTAVAAGFLAMLALRKPAVLFNNPELLNTLFWALFSIGFFPFLVRDAGQGDSPLNCVLLCTVLICAPLLRIRGLWYVFAASLAVNLAAAAYAAQSAAVPFQYYLELTAINIVGFFSARNLHGRYFSLLDEQRRIYSRQLADKLEQEALQLRIEQDRLVNASRTEFLSHMSHDLRTPLNAVIGLSDIAMDENLPPEAVRGYLIDINNSAKHLLSLVNDVLDMTKIETRKMVLRPEPYPLAEFLAVTNSVIGAQCAAKRISFKSDCDDGFPPALYIDRLRFNQIFLNLLSNALKFTPAGGTISLQLAHRSLPDGRVAVRAAVKDNGRGMDPAFAAKAFDAFAQESSEDRERGAGLGLTIVKSIVELMGGTIELNSEPGKGTEAVVCLEAAAAELPTAADPPAPVFQGQRILVCEDHPLNQKVAQHLLERQGLAVDLAGNGQEGVAKFAASPAGYYQAVLMDIRMPVLDGLAAARQIRGLDRPDARSVPIIAMTANAYDEDRELSSAAGMNAHLCKPVEPEELYRVLAGFLTGAAG